MVWPQNKKVVSWLLASGLTIIISTTVPVSIKIQDVLMCDTIHKDWEWKNELPNRYSALGEGKINIIIQGVSVCECV